MKNKQLLITLLPLLALSACNKATYKLDLQVATPAGSPSTAFYKYLGDTEHLEVNGNANNVIAYFTSTDSSQRKDIVVAPTNAGIAAINKGAQFKIAATITFGNFFLLSTGKDEDGNLNEGDKVYAFQQNGVAGKLFNYVYGDKGLDVTYLTDAASVKNEILTNKDFDADYVLLAQPVVAAILGQKSDYKIYANVQNDYKTKSGNHEITQASVFVRNDVDTKVAKRFLSSIKSDVEELLKNPEQAINKYTSEIEDPVFSTKLTGTKQLITTLLTNNNQIGLGYKAAFENKASIDLFIKALGLPESNEEIYFRTDK